MSTSTKTLLAVVAAAVVGFLLMQAFLQWPTSKPLTTEERRAQLDDMVAGVKPTLPMKVHPLVTWFDIKAEKDMIVYKYKIHVQRNNVVSKRGQMEAEL